MSAPHKAYSDGSEDEIADRSEGEGSGLQPRGTFARASAERLPPEPDDADREPGEPEEPEHGPVDPDAPEPAQQRRAVVAPPPPPPAQPRAKRSQPPPPERIDFDLVVQEARTKGRSDSFESASLIPSAPRSRSLEAPSSYPPPRRKRSPALLIGTAAGASLALLAGALWMLHTDRTEPRAVHTESKRGEAQRTEHPVVQRVESAATETEPRRNDSPVETPHADVDHRAAPVARVALPAEPVEAPLVTKVLPVSEARRPLQAQPATRTSTAPTRSVLSELQEEREIARERNAAPQAATPLPAAVAPQTTSLEASVSTLPDTPVREHVLAAFDGVRNSVRACLQGPRVVPVRVTVASSGRVTTALVLSSDLAGTPEGSCVARAIRAARFPAFSRPYFVIDYPFQL